ncbi:hypothetical protein ILUMI_18699, partial [Ignelater luminosus]
SNREIKTLRCLLDSASQSHFICEYACKLLNFKLIPTKMSVTDINQTTSHLNYRVQLTISSRGNNFKTQLTCFVLPKVASALPEVTIPKGSFEISPNIKLAYPKFNESRDIDILIGAELFWKILCVEQFKNKNGTSLQKTQFGWVVSGQVDFSPSMEMASYLSLSDPLHEELQRFWKIDEFFTREKILTSDKLLFKQSTSRARTASS